MNKKIFIITLITLFSFSNSIYESMEEFNSLIKKYKKHYSSESEYKKRYEIYKENKKKIQTQNKNSKNTKYTLNEFFDITEEEFSQKYTSKIPMDKKFLSTIKKAEIKLEPNEIIPEEYDWSKIIPQNIKKQGECGGCWAFSTTSILESKYYNLTKKKVILSEQELIDCSKTNNGCQGGAMEKSFKYLLETGVCLEKNYPYEERDELECRKKEENDIVKVKSFQFISEKEEEMKIALYKFGPLAGAINSYPLMFYSNGIYQPSFSWFCPPMINHAIVIVGYGVENGVKYWKVKNSWGSDWGEDGYFRLVRGEEACGINVYTLTAEAEIIKEVDE